MSLGGVGFYSLTTTVAPGAGTKIGAHEVMVSDGKVYYQGVVIGFIDNLGQFQPVDNTKPLPVSLQSSLVPERYNAIYATYPTATTEVYTYELSAVVVAIITVTYTSSTKDVLTSVVRT